MIKLETHCHTFGTSICADNDDNITISKYVKAGYGGIVVNNHLSKVVYANSCKGNNHEEKMNSFFAFIDEFKIKCEKVGFKGFWGAEIRSVVDGQEYSIIGLPRRVFYKEPPLFMLSQSELFNLSNEYGAFMYQTHPFREGVIAGSPNFLHGAEAFNGHYHHYNNNDKARKFVKDNGLIGISGTDHHHFDQPITAGIYLPESIENESQLAKFLLNGNIKFIEEEEIYLKELKRHKESQR